MNATAIETVPTIWSDERDVAFFRITASLFSPEFVLGASVLLASYDADDAAALGSGSGQADALPDQRYDATSPEPIRAR